MKTKLLLEHLIHDKDPQKYLQLLELIELLLLKYGKKLKFPKFVSLLEESNPDTVAMIQLLNVNNLLQSAKLSAFIRSFKAKLPSTSQTFSIQSNNQEQSKQIHKQLQKKFGKKVQVVFEKGNSESIGIKVKGKGLIFKRSLDQDINKLLA